MQAPALSRVGLVCWLMLCGDLAVLQASMFDGLSLDPFALFDDGIGPAEVGVGRGDVVEALVVAAMVVVLDEGLDNVTPADAYFGRAETIIKQRERIKRNTIEQRRL